MESKGRIDALGSLSEDEGSDDEGVESDNEGTESEEEGSDGCSNDKENQCNYNNTVSSKVQCTCNTVIIIV